MSKKGLPQMILVYTGTLNEKETDLENVLKAKNLEYKKIGDGQLDMVIEDIIDLAPEEITDTKGEMEPFLYLGEMNAEQVGELDASLKEAGLEIERKAVSTPTNMQWELGILMKEIDREAAWFKKRETLYNRILSADRERIKTDGPYIEVYMDAVDVFKNENSTDEELAAMLARLDEADAR